MTYLKYPSIENHYREKYINMMLEHNPKVYDCAYVVQEKIHGANISFLFTPEEEGGFPNRFQVFSRNNQLDPLSNEFYGLRDVLSEPDMVVFLQRVQRKTNRIGVPVRLFGEMFGGNIQKGVWYGPEKRILFFDMMLGDNFCTPTRMIDFMMSIDQVKDWFVPIFDRTTSLEGALNLDIAKNSLLTPKNWEDTNIMEGVVIKPYFDVVLDWNNKPFYLKKKNDDFKEKQKVAKIVIEVDENVQSLKEECLSYVNENRINSLFSKMGPISDKKQIPEYLKAIHEDVMVDFMKDCGDDFEILDKKSQKYITKGIGNTAIKFLLKNI